MSLSSKALNPFEELCRNQYLSLLEAGYQLRPRYHPDRTVDELEASQTSASQTSGVKHWNELSVAHVGFPAENTIDAIFNGIPVVLKFVEDLAVKARYDQPMLVDTNPLTQTYQTRTTVKIRYYSDELVINRFLGGITAPNRTSAAPETDRDRHSHRPNHQKYNHCLPVLNELTLADVDHKHSLRPNSLAGSGYRCNNGVSLSKILVHPMVREWFNPGFETIGEVLDFLWQAFIGLQFIHKHGVAVRITKLFADIVMDANEMFPEGYHFILRLVDPTLKHRAKCLGPRSEYPPKYYWRLSKPLQAPISITPIAIPQDVYNLGEQITWVFMNEANPRRMMHGISFLKPLITSMLDPSPENRLTMDQAVIALRDLIVDLPESKLREPIGPDHKYKAVSRESLRFPLPPGASKRRSWQWLSDLRRGKMRTPGFPKRKDVVSPWDYEDYDLEGSGEELQLNYAKFESMKLDLHNCQRSKSKQSS